MPDFDIRALAPYLTHAGLGLLQRGDPFANVQRGLLIGGQVAAAEEKKKREKEERERLKKALAKIAEASRGQAAPVRTPPGRGPSTPPPGPASAPPNFRLDQGGAANLGLLRRNQDPATRLDAAIAAGGGSTGLNQAPAALRNVPAADLPGLGAGLIGGAGPVPADPVLGLGQNEVIDTKTGARLQIPAPPMLGGPEGQAAPAGALGASSQLAPGAFAGPPGAPPTPQSPAIDPVAAALLQSGIPSLVAQGAALYGQRLTAVDKRALEAQSRGFTAEQNELDRNLRRVEAQRSRGFDAQQKGLDRQQRDEHHRDTLGMKQHLAQLKANKPKNPTDAAKRALAGGESMLTALNNVEQMVGSGAVDPTNPWGIARELGGAVTTSEARLEFNANYNRVVEGLVSAMPGVASDKDVDRLMKLYRPRLGDTQDVFKQKYIGLLGEAKRLFGIVAGKARGGRMNEEQIMAAQMIQQLNQRIDRIRSQPDLRGFSDIAGQGQAPAQQPPALNFSQASRQDIGNILPSEGF